MEATGLPWHIPERQETLKSFLKVVEICNQACVDNEDMDEQHIAANANTITNAVEKKLPNGDKNIKKIMIKTTMGKAVKLEQVKK